MRRLTLVLSATLLALFGVLGTALIPSASAATAPLAPVKVMRIVVDKKREAVLTTLTGRTLYYFSKDTPTKSACVGKCATLWPALVTKTNVKLFRDPAGVKGRFTTVKDAHGWQVAYNGHLLYTFVLDKKPGQAHGQGFKKIWWVATPGLTPLAGTTSKSSGGSGSGW
jgi:predicted lipoprotein with Yx(FWY)xxD motif